jgi:hypothetical protein
VKTTRTRSASPQSDRRKIIPSVFTNRTSRDIVSFSCFNLSPTNSIEGNFQNVTPLSLQLVKKSGIVLVQLRAVVVGLIEEYSPQMSWTTPGADKGRPMSFKRRPKVRDDRFSGISPLNAAGQAPQNGKNSV